MNRLAGLLTAFLPLCASAVFAQQASPQTPEDAFTSRQLIAWSWLQKPQPAPQPLPPRDTPIPQPNQSQDQQSKPPADSGRQQEPVQSFTGKIIKQGGEYILRVSANSNYELDGADDLQQYENKNVRVTGNVDPGTTTIHVVKIDLIS